MLALFRLLLNTAVNKRILPMKKIFYIVALLLSLTACKPNMDKYDNVDILIFTQQGCSHCEKAMDFINNRLKVKNPALQVVQIDVSYDSENIKLLKHYLKKYDFNGDSVGTPIIVFNKQMLMGWGLQNKVKLQKAFEFILE